MLFAELQCRFFWIGIVIIDDTDVSFSMKVSVVNKSIDNLSSGKANWVVCFKNKFPWQSYFAVIQMLFLDSAASLLLHILYNFLGIFNKAYSLYNNNIKLL